jgi:hypothetical protein
VDEGLVHTKQKKYMKTIKNLVCPALTLLAFVCFALAPQARATCVDSCLPGFNVVQGDDGFNLLTTGEGNTGLGWRVLFSVGAGSFNTAVGAGALVLNTASNNTATGAAALLLDTIGTSNTANGTAALEFNDKANNNTANGAFALLNNDVSLSGLGNANTAVGSGALQNNVDGDSNTAVGAFALFNENATGGFPNGVSNNAIGRQALTSLTTGSFNEAFGVNALGANTTSSGNIAIGDDAMFAYTGNGTTAGGNTAVGGGALSALLTGTLNTALGTGAGSVDNGGETNNIYIGDTGATGDMNIIAIGNLPATGTNYNVCFIGNASTAVVMPGIVPGVLTSFQDVGVDAGGGLGTFTSSARFKENIKPMDKASEAIFALKPVTFRYKKEFDPAGAEQLGLIAEDVAKVTPTCVALDRDGKPISVNYRPVTAMLLNEFLKEHKAFVEEQHTVQEQGATIARLEQQIEALTAVVQKVSAQLEVSKPAPQTVLNNQ